MIGLLEGHHGAQRMIVNELHTHRRKKDQPRK